MDQAYARSRQSNGLLLSLTTVAVTMVSLVAWLLISLGTVFSWLWGTEWIYTGLALPAATVGAILTHVTDRRAYFLVGLAITLIPLVAYVVLSAEAPPPPPGWND